MQGKVQSYRAWSGAGGPEAAAVLSGFSHTGKGMGEPGARRSQQDPRCEASASRSRVKIYRAEREPRQGPPRSMTTSYIVFRRHQNFTAALVVRLLLCERSLRKAVLLILHRRSKAHASFSETETPQEPPACCSLPHLQS